MAKQLKTKNMKIENLINETKQVADLALEIWNLGDHDGEMKKENQTDHIRTHLTKLESCSDEQIEKYLKYYNDGYNSARLN